MRIIFMGTPAFAVPSLTALLDAGYDVVAAVTQPDRPSGRGKKLTPGPVKELALTRGVEVLQFQRIRREEGLAALGALQPDLFVTAAFGQILSQQVLDIPQLGTVNVHASLLPGYRGPAPINWCIIEGETETGVTTMMTDAGIDTGDILLQSKTTVGLDETAGTLTDRLSALGAELLIETLRRIEAGDCPRTPQDEALASYHPMLKKEHGRIDWTQGATAVSNRVRGVNPWPGAWTTLPDGGTLKIWSAKAGEPRNEADRTAAPGTILHADGKNGMAVRCGEGVLDIVELQAPNAKRMAAADYLRGHPITPGTRLGIKES